LLREDIARRLTFEIDHERSTVEKLLSLAAKEPSLLSGQEYTVPGLFIANGVDEQPPVMPIAAAAAPAPGPGAAPPPAHNGPAYWIKVSAKEDGSFTVTNARNGFSKSYAAR
jgi:hypothetical protein